MINQYAGYRPPAPQRANPAKTTPQFPGTAHTGTGFVAPMPITDGRGFGQVAGQAKGPLQPPSPFSGYMGQQAPAWMGGVQPAQQQSQAQPWQGGLGQIQQRLPAQTGTANPFMQQFSQPLQQPQQIPQNPYNPFQNNWNWNQSGPFPGGRFPAY